MASNLFSSATWSTQREPSGTCRFPKPLHPNRGYSAVDVGVDVIVVVGVDETVVVAVVDSVVDGVVVVVGVVVKVVDTVVVSVDVAVVEGVVVIVVLGVLVTVVVGLLVAVVVAVEVGLVVPVLVGVVISHSLKVPSKYDARAAFIVSTASLQPLGSNAIYFPMCLEMGNPSPRVYSSSIYSRSEAASPPTDSSANTSRPSDSTHVNGGASSGSPVLKHAFRNRLTMSTWPLQLVSSLMKMFPKDVQ